MLDWKQKKAQLRKQVKAHQIEHLKIMNNILKDKSLNSTVERNGKRGIIRPTVKAYPDIYELHEFMFFIFGPSGKKISEDGIPVGLKELGQFKRSR